MWSSFNSSVRNAILFLSLAIALLFFDGRGWLGWWPDVLGTLTVPFQGWVSLSYFSLRDGWNQRYNNNAPLTQAGQLERIAELEARVAQLEAENIQLREQVAERDRLAQILGYQQTLPDPQYLVANVVGANPDGLFDYILLDRGYVDGVRVGYPVVSANGLVGLVVEAPTRFCKVLLITDPSLRVNVRVQETRADGIVSGQENGNVRLSFVPQGIALAEGQIVLTSGLAGGFPPGIPVGTLRAVRDRLFDVGQEADVVPFVNFHTLETAMVITNFQPLNTDPAFPQEIAP